MSADDVLAYWFGTEPITTDDKAKQRLGFWFRGAKEIDEEIRAKFGDTVAAAQKGELDSWAETPRGRLALIIVLDQFTRNVHRGKPLAFKSDSHAQALTLGGIEKKADADFNVLERIFFAMPLVHAEKIALQETSMAYFESLEKVAPPELLPTATITLAHARDHHDQIAKFGRFPGRNHILGRTSTGDEMTHLFQQKTPRA